MNVTKNVKDKTTIELKIEVGADEMKPYIDKAVKRISKEVKIDGFRAGSAPYEILVKKVGEMEIHQEAARDAVDDTLPIAIKREDIEFVGQPQINIEKVAPGNPLGYTATLALMPSVDLKGYKDVRVAKKPIEIDESKFKSTLEELQKMRATNKAVDRAAKKGDQVITDFDVTLAGVPVEGGQGKDVPIVLGEGQFIPGFEEEVTGMKKDESKKFMLTFPKEYSAKHLAGKKCEFSVTMKSVNEIELPELNDEFAKSMNFKSQAELEGQIRGNIQQELEQKQGREYENEVMKAVIDQAEFDPIPDMMVEQELDRMMQEMRQEVESQGGTMKDYLEHIKKTEAELRETWKEQGDRRVKGALVLKAVGEAENVVVSDADIDKEVEKYRTIYKESPEELKQIEGDDFRVYARSMIRNQKVIDVITSIAGGNDKKSEKKADEKKSDK